MGPAPAVATIRCAVRGVLADLDEGDLVLVACSGGTDSLALAAATAFVAPRLGLRAGGLTVDHGLQEGSDRRARDVADVLTTRGFDPVEVLPVVVGRAGGPEAAARAARYAALDAAADRLGAAAVLLGHTRDDQAETVLLGLARGSGARSLAGMPAAFRNYRRPLLDLPRSLTAAACHAEGLTPWDDPHNADPAYTRARVRHAALPALAAALGPGMPEALARTARLLREDTEALDAWSEREFAACHSLDGTLGCLAVEPLAALPSAVRRRVIRLAALAAGCPGGTLAAVHIEAVDALVTTWRGQGPLQLPGPVIVRRHAGRLLFDTANARRPTFPAPTRTPTPVG
jgi:tRNA(Ile)-lysidine synthase